MNTEKDPPPQLKKEGGGVPDVSRDLQENNLSWKTLETIFSFISGALQIMWTFKQYLN